MMRKEWHLWEVFIRSPHGMAHRHVGNLHAESGDGDQDRPRCPRTTELRSDPERGYGRRDSDYLRQRIRPTVRQDRAAQRASAARVGHSGMAATSLAWCDMVIRRDPAHAPLPARMCTGKVAGQARDGSVPVEEIRAWPHEVTGPVIPLISTVDLSPGHSIAVGPTANAMTPRNDDYIGM